MMPVPEKCCHICQSPVSKIFQAHILGKYPAFYFQCAECGFIQTSSPHWLQEAYSDAITSLDIGLVHRNLQLAKKTERIILECFDGKGKFLDYAGGYGLFVRMMRDKGFNFFWYDAFCANLFAKNFELPSNPNNGSKPFELVTTFESFEHFENPAEELEKIAQYSDSVLFTTELQPPQSFSKADDWWYFAPEHGQHISFFTEKALKILGERSGFYFYSNGFDLHLFSRKKFRRNPCKLTTTPSRILHKLADLVFKLEHWRQAAGMQSLLSQDYENAKSRLQASFKDQS